MWATGWRGGGASRQATSQPSKRGQRATAPSTGRPHVVAFSRLASQAPTSQAAKVPASLPASQPASHPPRIHRGSPCPAPPATLYHTFPAFPCRKPSEECWAADTPVGNRVERSGSRQAGRQPSKHACRQQGGSSQQQHTICSEEPARQPGSRSASWRGSQPDIPTDRQLPD